MRADDAAKLSDSNERGLVIARINSAINMGNRIVYIRNVTDETKKELEDAGYKVRPCGSQIEISW